MTYCIHCGAPEKPVARKGYFSTQTGEQLYNLYKQCSNLLCIGHWMFSACTEYSDVTKVQADEWVATQTNGG